MGHLDDDNLPRYTVRVHFKHGELEIFNNTTDVDESDTRVEFKDRNGKQHIFQGVPFHVAEE